MTTANPVAYWNKIGTDTTNVAATPGTGTPEEQRPGGAVDLATLHVAIYDAVMAIVGTHEPFAPTPPGTNPEGAAQEAAVAPAAYGVLKGMFPNRSAQYQGAYDSHLAELPDGDAKTRGLAIGAEVWLALSAGSVCRSRTKRSASTSVGFWVLALALVKAIHSALFQNHSRHL